MVTEPAAACCGMRRAWTGILAALAFFIALEAILFHTGTYVSIVEPDSTTGSMETLLRIEAERPKSEGRQVLILGDSRMVGFRPRIANKFDFETGCTFGTVALGGVPPRCWSYNLRAVDPGRNRYAAVVVPSDDYDEPDHIDDLRNREADLHYMIARLGLGDLFDFPWTFARPELQRRAFLGILFKGYIYKRDFLQLLLHPLARLEKVSLYRRGAADWMYTYEAPAQSLAGLVIDRQSRTVHYPDGIQPPQRQLVDKLLQEKLPPDRGITTAYFQRWFGRIVDYYQGTGTKVIFLRFPRIVSPFAPIPPKPDSAVRRMAYRPNVVVLDEHRFAALERPEFFIDALHLNRYGMELFSEMVAKEAGRVLGQPGK